MKGKIHRIVFFFTLAVSTLLLLPGAAEAETFAPPLLVEYQFPFADQNGFYLDLLHDGTMQKITMDREKKDDGAHTKINIASDTQLLFQCTVQGNGNRNWYVTRLRDEHTPELIYVFLSGSGAFLNDFKIIGKKANGTIGVLLDLDELKKFGNVGGQFKLFVDDFSDQPTLRMHGTFGNFSLRWDGVAFVLAK